MTDTKATSRYTLPGPCSNCPFRSDVKFEGLREERVIEIAEELLGGGEFHCHKTVDYSDDEEGPQVASKTRVCGGAVATLANEGKSTQMSRITERLGLKVAEPDSEAPVYGSMAEWVRAMNPAPTATSTFRGVTETMELEHCGVVGPDCVDPAGFMTGMGASENLEMPTCNPFEGCEACGSVMCSECRSSTDPTYCIHCAENEEDDDE